MNTLDLWLPILLSGLATHILCTIAWTVSPHHKPEWTKLPAEPELLDLLHSRQIASGQFVFPFCADGKESQSPEFQEKQKKSRGMLVVWPAPVNMGSAILKTLTFFFIAAFTIGYLATLALEPGASFSKVFQFVTSAGLLAHVFAHFPHVFWFPRKMAMEILDGFVFAVVTGLIFAALWPAA
jgi:hypothetical protein